jgi:hypothetical protein
MTCEAMSDHIVLGERTWARLRSGCPKDEPRLSPQLGIYTIWIRESLSALV